MFGSRREFLVAFTTVVFGTITIQPTNAQFQESSSAKTVTAASEIVRTPVGRLVKLSGSLKRNVRRAQYIFADRTGEARVRIEREVWRGRKISRQDRIEIRGKVENDVRGRFVDVYAFKILK